MELTTQLRGKTLRLDLKKPKQAVSCRPGAHWERADPAETARKGLGRGPPQAARIRQGTALPTKSPRLPTWAHRVPHAKVGKPPT